MAASPDFDVAVGWTLAIEGATTNNGLTFIINGVTWPETTVDDILTSHQGTTEAHTHAPADLLETGTCTINVNFESDNIPVVGVEDEQFRLTAPDTNYNTFTGYIQSFPPDAAELNTKMTAVMVIKVSGAHAVTTP